MKSFSYYSKRFKNVESWAIGRVYNNNPWAIELLDVSLIDTRKCYTGFFMFLTTKLITIGQSNIEQVIALKIPVYDYIIEHQKRKTLTEKILG